MDHNFYDNDGFEDFLKQKADQYKMYPSDRVWNNIYSSLHGRKRWMIVGFVLLFLSSSLFIGRQTILSNYTRVARQINKVPEASFLAIDGLDRNKTTQPLQVNQNLTLSTDQSNRLQLPPAKVTENKDGHQSQNYVSNSSIVITPEKEWSVIRTFAISVPSNIAAITDKHALTITPVEKKSVAGIEGEKNRENDPTRFVKDRAIVKQPAKLSNLFIQFYASPIVSYRRLYNDGQTSYAAPVSASYGDNINNYVHHKPAMGFEAGSKILYKLSNSLSVYAGAQLNYSRYYVDAYKFHVEKASIALNDSRLDTLSGYTDIRNFSGYSPEQLQNQYWQLSVPLGVEIKLLGNKKLQLNVAGGIQPTFLLHSNSYLISSDYKNYIQHPDLARSFNVHTNFEAFLSYQTGGIKWQLGPQFRSQLLSSYSTQYRVREYLTEFGIKFGITKSLR